MHHPRRQNVTTSKVGFFLKKKTVTCTKIAPKMANPRDIAREGRRRRRMVNPRDIAGEGRRRKSVSLRPVPISSRKGRIHCLRGVSGTQLNPNGRVPGRIDSQATYIVYPVCFGVHLVFFFFLCRSVEAQVLSWVPAANT